MSTRTISVCSWKGGVGKTTTSQHLAHALVRAGKSVLLVDLDPMHGLSTSCGIRRPERSMTDVFEARFNLADVVVQSADGLRIVPADTTLAGVERALQNEVAREQFLKRFLEGVSYDYVIIDTPPALGILTMNAFMASRGLIVATDSKFLSLEGLVLVFDSIQKVQTRLNPDLQILGVLPTMFTRTVHARECLEETRSFLQKNLGRAAVFNPIPYTIRFAEASTAGRTVFDYAPDFEGAKAYESLAEEVIRWATDGSLCVEASTSSTEAPPSIDSPAVA
ncbi:MAG: ParA family protein [Planctomycetes bacterium]|nr:ParA family protein [Planctomycetota bacterium]